MLHLVPSGLRATAKGDGGDPSDEDSSTSEHGERRAGRSRERRARRETAALLAVRVTLALALAVGVLALLALLRVSLRVLQRRGIAKVEQSVHEALTEKEFLIVVAASWGVRVNVAWWLSAVS
jgi:H+/Cl- antiporter ClcA